MKGEENMLMTLNTTNTSKINYSKFTSLGCGGGVNDHLE